MNSGGTYEIIDGEKVLIRPPSDAALEPKEDEPEESGFFIEENKEDK